ncbi:MAG: sulfite exporter TauE/SafE family protein [Methanoregula sp.]|nr:sulfite exporter TauE/SafE family protein [Methanoregula sp.]
MSDLLTYFYLFPLGIAIALLAISAGISGSNFWIPVYVIWLDIDPKTSFWLALLTMLFGFGSGIVRNLKNRTINWPIVKQYLKIAVPFVIVGSLLVPFAPAELLLVLFGSFVIIYGAFLIYRFGLRPRENEPAFGETGEKIYWFQAATAGFLKGLIATGTGKIIMPCVLKHCKIRTPAEAVGTTIVIIFVVNLFAVLFRLTPDFISTLAEQKDLIFTIMIWVAPGVIIGGQIGPDIAKKLSKRGIRIYVGILLIFVGLLIYMRSFPGF